MEETRKTKIAMCGGTFTCSGCGSPHRCPRAPSMTIETTGGARQFCVWHGVRVVGVRQGRWPAFTPGGSLGTLKPIPMGVN